MLIIISPNEVFGDIMVLASPPRPRPPRPPVDSEQCSNQLELYLISLLVNFSCELGQTMTRYDFLWVR